jgi:cell division protein FtsI (penicillin-binding protein 3)
VHRDIDRPVLNRVVENTSLDSLKSFLRGVVERGTAKVVNSEVVAIAGKTGTAQLPDTVNKVYFQNKFAATFAGFFPAESPTIAGAVILIDPQPLHYGGLTSGPAFRRIAERYALVNSGLLSLPDKSLAEKDRPTDSVTTAPDLVGASCTFAQELADERGIALRSTAAEGTVVWQYPPPGRMVYKGDDLLVAVSRPDDSVVRMPDMTGLGLRKASAFLHFAGVRFAVRGSGRVVNQSIRAGDTLAGDSTCLIECEQPL